MEETFKNRYVIKVEGGHGWTHYHIVSTLSGFKEMLNSVRASVDGIEYMSEKDPQFEVPIKSLWGDNATLAQGRTSKIYLSFDLDRDLSAYHKRRFWQRPVGQIILFLVFISIMLLALVGLFSVIRLLVTSGGS